MSAVDAAAPPHTLSQFVLKVHGRCDLACDHCYVYEHADQSWRRRSRAMAIDTVRVAAAKIAEHAANHRLPRVHVVFHGGEPLLLGVAAMRSAIEAVRTAIEAVTTLDLGMQSNGVLLSEEFCDLFAEHGVRLGISLDGDRDANDRHRRYANGSSSYDQVLRALELLRRPQYRSVYGGLLCTVDIRNDPIRVYRALLAEKPPRVDFLLPHSTWDSPPFRPPVHPTPYADWLAQIYDQWLSDGRPVRVRLFESLISSGSGGPSGSEWVGLDRADLAVIETDGEWEQVDSLKTAFDGAPATGLSVFTHSVDEVAALPEIARRQRGLADLCPTCQTCPVVKQCGGGLFAHRYRTGAGFDNPSVYCDDLKGLINYMNERPVRAAASAQGSTREDDELPAEILDEIGSGYGSAAAIRVLADAEFAITRALLVTLSQDLDQNSAAGQAWALLVQLDRMAPEAVRSVLSHPYVRPWAVACLNRPAGSRANDMQYLSCLAAVIAQRSKVDVSLPVPMRHGQVYLPTLGVASLPSDATDMARVTVGADGLTVAAAGSTVVVRPDDLQTTPGWRPATYVRADGLDVLLEDGDPHRDIHEWTTREHLDADDAVQWHQSLVGAWRQIADEASAYRPGLQEGLRTVVPLQTDPSGLMRASTARHAFGSVAAARTDAPELAVMLVHEFQHGKLGAVLDVCELFDPTDPRRIRVGWREDPRPIEGVLQGTYAHLAVADIWRNRAAGTNDQPALRNFHQYRDWTAEAIEVLTGSGALTPIGIRFCEQMTLTVAAWSR
jgi:uncharacterized protein